jgi:hypothetical protein
MVTHSAWESAKRFRAALLAAERCSDAGRGIDGASHLHRQSIRERFGLRSARYPHGDTSVPAGFVTVTYPISRLQMANARLGLVTDSRSEINPETEDRSMQRLS